jgi:hypothetical protein
VGFPHCFESLTRDQIERRLGKPATEINHDNYVLPMACPMVVRPSGLDAARGGKVDSEFYELKDVGGVTVYFSTKGVPASDVVVHLRVDKQFVPLKAPADIEARAAWEVEKLRSLKKWLGIAEDAAKNDQGAVELRR